MSRFLANTEGQDLKQHLLGVAKRSIEVLKTLNLKEDEFNFLKKTVYLSGLFHDIGKVDKSFQKFIKRKRSEMKESTDAEENRNSEKWHGVFHQEISWAALKRFVNISTTDGGKNLNDVVAYAVYWHHPKATGETCDSSTKIMDVVQEENPEILSDVKGIIEELLKESEVEFVLNKHEQTDDIVVPEFFNLSGNILKNKDVVNQSYKTITVTCLIEADREVSSWSKELLCEYLEGKQIPVEVNYTACFPEPKTQEGVRGVKQQDLSRELSQTSHCNSVCAVDTGAGKTRIALLWKGFNLSNKKLIVALPKRRQVDALYYSIQNDIGHIFDTTPTMQAVHGGQVQLPEDHKPEILKSDINIVVFDQMLKSFYRREEIKNFMCILRSDIVFDEYHEFLFIPNMLPSLLVLIKIRSWMQGSKTLFLSGTANPAFNKILFDMKDVPYLFKSRDSLPEVHSNTATYSYSTEPNILSQEDKHVLQSFNRVDDATESWISQGDKSKMNVYHSRYSERDLKTHIQRLLTTFGKNSKEEGNAISALILQSSFDCSFKNAKLTLSFPDTVAQFLGRKDRHGDKPDGYVVIHRDSGAIKSFASDKAGFIDTYRQYERYVEKLLSSPKVWSHREATVNLYDNFWKQDGVVETLISDIEYKISQACREMKIHYPKKKGKIDPTKKVSGGLFRGTSSFVASKKVDLDGNVIGVTSQEDLISISADYIVEALKGAFKRLNKAHFVNSFQGFETGEYLKGKRRKFEEWRHGKFSETPLFCSHNNPEVDKILKEALDNEGDTCYYVYNEQIGLVKESIIKRINERD